MPRCAATRGRRRRRRPGRRSGRTAARLSRLPPRSGPECCRGAGRSSRAGAGDGPDLPPDGGGCVPSRAGAGDGPVGSVRMWIWGLKPPRLRPSAFVLGRACRAAVRALTVLSCHTADRSGWPAGRPSGAARRPDRADGHSGDRPISTFRTRSATAAKGCPTAPLGIGHRGPSSRRWGQGIALGEDNGWPAGCPIRRELCRRPLDLVESKRPRDLIAGSQDITSTLPGRGSRDAQHPPRATCRRQLA